MSFETDTIHKLYEELSDVDRELNQLGIDIVGDANEAVRAAALYENLKNQMLTEMYAEEAVNKTKRTEKQREVLYRTEFKHQRLARDLAKQKTIINREYLDILKARQMNLQTRINLLKGDYGQSF